MSPLQAHPAKAQPMVRERPRTLSPCCKGARRSIRSSRPNNRFSTGGDNTMTATGTATSTQK